MDRTLATDGLFPTVTMAEFSQNIPDDLRNWKPPAPKSAEDTEFEAEVGPLLLGDGVYDDAASQAGSWKDVGNALFKDGKHAWAIRVYADAVAQYQRREFEDKRNGMLMDPAGGAFATACASNSALCALKARFVWLRARDAIFNDAIRTTFRATRDGA